MKKLARPDLGLQLEAAGSARTPVVEVLLHLLEQRLEPVEVLAFLAVGDLLGGALLGGWCGRGEVR